MNESHLAFNKKNNNFQINNHDDKNENVLLCWGLNSYGQAAPPVNDLINIISVSLGFVHSCILNLKG